MAQPDRSIWSDVLSYLRTHHTGVCRQWFEEIEPRKISGGVWELFVGQPLHRKYLQRECSSLFNEAVQAVTGHLVSVRFVGSDDVQVRNGIHLSAPAPSSNHKMQGNGHLSDHDSLVLSPDYTFDSFVVGPESRLAHAAAVAVADRPAAAYNPLFIHGGVGLGKTHLLQAICHQVLVTRSDAQIHYVSCEGFMTQFMNAVQAGQMADFRHRFRDIDILVIDDIHFLARRDQIQEEFFHTFNALYQSHKQIVLSSDAHPTEIPDLKERLVSRFQQGLVVQIDPPGYDTRVQIVKQKGAMRGLVVPDDVACHIAAQISANIRELEGAVTRLQAMRETEKQPINLDLAKRAIDEPSGRPRQEITITEIIDAVVDYYGVKLTDLQSKRRQKSIAHPRQVCMYLARKHTRYSLEEIGGYFGGRDHTTVMHAVRTIERRATDDDGFRTVLTSLSDKFRATPA